jgi:Putative serine esterase (DUF676)
MRRFRVCTRKAFRAKSTRYRHYNVSCSFAIILVIFASGCQVVFAQLDCPAPTAPEQKSLPVGVVGCGYGTALFLSPPYGGCILPNSAVAGNLQQGLTVGTFFSGPQPDGGGFVDIEVHGEPQQVGTSSFSITAVADSRFCSPSPFPSPPYPSQCGGPTPSQSYSIQIVNAASCAPPILLDPAPELISKDGPYVTNDPTILATGDGIVHGVTADGVTQAVVQIRSQHSGDTLTLSLKDGNGQTGSVSDIGGLAPPGPTPNFASTITVTAVSTNTGPMAFAVYQAPAEFVRPNSTDKNANMRAVQLIATDATGLAVAPLFINILRPPIALIHGVWTDKSTWMVNGFQDALARQLPGMTLGQNIFPLDYGPTKAAFIESNEKLMLSYLIDDLKTFKVINSVASVQWDIVSHSMGGLITRAMPLDDRFLQNQNFNRGYVHKLITIDTPHAGSEWASRLITTGSTLPLSLTCPTGMRLINKSIDQGAIADLAVGSDFLQFLTGAKSTIKAHAIVGITGPLFESNLLVTAALIGFSSVIGCPGIVGTGGVPSIFGNTANDVIVSSASQRLSSGTTFVNPNSVSHFQFPNPFGVQLLGMQIGPIGALNANSGNVEAVVDALNSASSSTAFQDVQ